MAYYNAERNHILGPTLDSEWRNHNQVALDSEWRNHNKVVQPNHIRSYIGFIMAQPYLGCATIYEVPHWIQSGASGATIC
jgi:hypothetical protein